MPGIKPSQIKAVIKKAKSRHTGIETRMIGISSPFAWTAHGPIEVDGDAYDVVQCCSELEMREVLATATSQGRSTVVITALADKDVAEDVQVRLYRRKFHSLDAWDNVKSIYAANLIDPRLFKYGWIADELLDVDSSDDVRPVPNGRLTAEYGWEIVLERLLGLRSGTPDIASLLIWTNSPDSQAKLALLDEERVQAVSSWLGQSAGALAEVIIRCARKRSASPLVVGLVCEVIYAREYRGSSRLAKAAIRLESVTTVQNLENDMATRWAKAASAAIQRLTDAGENNAIAAAFSESSDLLAQLEIAVHADRSQTLPAGFEQRLDTFGKALLQWIEKAEMPPELPELLEQLGQHRQGRIESHRIDRATMALRLVRYLHEPEVLADTFTAVVDDYRLSGGYVDWARKVLYSGESNGKVAQVYGRILEVIATRRHAQNQRFAEQLAWLTQNDTAAPKSVLFVEDILQRLDTQVATSALVIVLDGMSHAVFYELMSEFAPDWRMYDDEAGNFSATGLATIPSITKASRGSLLSGWLHETQSAGEKKHFGTSLKVAGHSAPRVFHKAELTVSGGGALTEELQAALASQAPILGAVVNAIDDDLDKGDQVVKKWNLQSLSVLDMLLKAAGENDRCVLLLSDHGHVLDRGTNKLDGGEDAGERYRPLHGEIYAGEITISGRRVVHQAGTLIVPWDEKIRYGHKKYGYHGGVTPQEMLVPIALLARKPHKTWRYRNLETPTWWTNEASSPRTPVVTHIRKVPAKVDGTKIDTQFKKLPLFAEVSAANEMVDVVASLPWVEKLLASEMYLAQREIYQRNPLKDEQVAMFLEVLERSGGKCLRPAMATQLKLPAIRATGFITHVCRLLNVDGYLSISVDETSDSITLNRPLLMTQFGLTPHGK